MIDHEATYHWGMRSDINYVSRAFPENRFNPDSRSSRFATRVIDSEHIHICDVDRDELVIRQTDGDREQIKVLFYEDDRSIKTLIFQRFTTQSGKPHRHSFSFSGEEIDRILWLLESVKHGQFDNPEKVRFSDRYLEELVSSDGDLLRFVQRHRERLGQIDGVGEFALYLEFRERQRQVDIFEALLYDPTYFLQLKTEWGKRRDEDVWQQFFEQNPWIFGLSLSPIFMSSLDGERLEQVVKGYSVASEGKRADAVMRTNGILSSLCFVEIKKHDTPLLNAKESYRSGTWSVSDDVSGAIAQCHTTIEAAMREFRTRLSLTDKEGNPTGDDIFIYQPRSYLVVGCLDEFLTDHGPNERKYRSFELFRRNLRSPEIVTFDELLARARATVECSPNMVR